MGNLRDRNGLLLKGSQTENENDNSNADRILDLLSKDLNEGLLSGLTNDLWETTTVNAWSRPDRSIPSLCQIAHTLGIFHRFWSHLAKIDWKDSSESLAICQLCDRDSWFLEPCHLYYSWITAWLKDQWISMQYARKDECKDSRDMDWCLSQL